MSGQASPNDSSFSGFLEQQFRSGSWRRRWFVASGGVLHVHKDDLPSSRPRASHNIQNAKVQATQCTFVIVLATDDGDDNGDAPMCLRAPTEELAAQWVERILTAQSQGAPGSTKSKSDIDREQQRLRRRHRRDHSRTTQQRYRSGGSVMDLLASSGAAAHAADRSLSMPVPAPRPAPPARPLADDSTARDAAAGVATGAKASAGVQPAAKASAKAAARVSAKAGARAGRREGAGEQAGRLLSGGDGSHSGSGLKAARSTAIAAAASSSAAAAASASAATPAASQAATTALGSTGTVVERRDSKDGFKHGFKDDFKDDQPSNTIGPSHAMSGEVQKLCSGMLRGRSWRPRFLVLHQQGLSYFKVLVRSCVRVGAVERWWERLER